MKKYVYLLCCVLIILYTACKPTVTANTNENAPAPTSSPAPGTLDTSFGNSGIVITDFDSQIDEANAIAIQSDGKILVAGVAKITGNNNDFAIVRYNADGTLDSSFGNNGKTTTNFGNLRNDVVCAIAIQTDGKIVVAGYTNEGGNLNFAVARYSINGSLDTSFSGDGMVYTDLNSSSTDCAYAIAIQGDGKILVAGYTIPNGGSIADIAVVRYKSDGSLDTEFSPNGIVITDIDNNKNDYARSIAIQPDGKILIGGDYNGNRFAIVRYNENGSLDTNFNINGKKVLQLGSGLHMGNSLVLQNDGKIILAGHANFTSSASYDFAIACLLSNGNIDNTFGTNGYVQTHFEGTNRNDYAYGAAIDSSGRIVVAGHTSITTNVYDFAYVRYNSNGAIDNSFSTIIHDIGSDDDRVTSVAIQSDGKILIAGKKKISDTNYDFVVIRLWP